MKGFEKYMKQRESWVNSAQQVTVLEVRSIHGEGTPHDPFHQVVEYFTLDGEKIGKLEREKCKISIQTL
ncbi:MAG: hypothetical protein RL642_295 [Bacteroidota bacterium]|jgi:hypothetical protein